MFAARVYRRRRRVFAPLRSDRVRVGVHQANDVPAADVRTHVRSARVLSGSDARAATTTTTGHFGRSSAASMVNVHD